MGQFLHMAKLALKDLEYDRYTRARGYYPTIEQKTIRAHQGRDGKEGENNIWWKLRTSKYIMKLFMTC